MEYDPDQAKAAARVFRPDVYRSALEATDNPLPTANSKVEGSVSEASGETVVAASLDGEIEKPNLKFGFIKLTDMAPLAIAKEKGCFAEEGLIVTLEPQANWKVLLDGVIGGQLDGAHMLAGQPLAATIG